MSVSAQRKWYHRLWPRTVRGILLAVALLALPLAGVACVTRWFEEERQSWRVVMCINNLKLISLALANYESVWRTYPPAYVADSQGRPLYSWRVVILPYLEQQTLYEQFDLTQAWDSPTNRPLLAQMPWCYICSADVGIPRGHTRYLAPVGQGTVMRGATGMTVQQVTDRFGQTLAVVEVPGSSVPWSAPIELDIDSPITPGRITLEGMVRSTARVHPRGVLAVMLDGSPWRFPFGLKAADYRALATIAGGEPVTKEGLTPPRN